MPIVTRIDVTAWNDREPRVEHNEALSDGYEEAAREFAYEVSDRAWTRLLASADVIPVADAAACMDRFCMDAADTILAHEGMQP